MHRYCENTPQKYFALGLTSPAQGTGQLTSQEPSSNDGYGFDLSGNLLQSLKVIHLDMGKSPELLSGGKTTL